MQPARPGAPEPQAALDKIKIIENHDPLVDLRSIPGLTFHATPGHEVIPYLRAPVAAMLREASLKLPKPYNLYVTSALRDFARQKYLWEFQCNRYRTAHPTWPEHAVRRMANKYAAPVDHAAPPGHTTGGAVDVVLQKPDGSFVDLVPPDINDWSLSETRTEKLGPEIHQLRMMLLETMTTAGFSNCRDEYWHYSWGDSGWAVRTGKSECYYGVVELPI